MKREAEIKKMSREEKDFLINLNKRLSLFAAKVYVTVSQIPTGKVMTYKHVAIKAGNPRAHRAVGNLMKNNPNQKTIPCHRVVCSDGSLGGYAFGGTSTKKKLLMKEGVEFQGDKVILQK